MKSLKTTFLALALIAGVSGAFATKAMHNASLKQTGIYNWVSTPGAPKNPSSTLPNASRSTAISNFGCEFGSNICAVGTKVSGSGPSTLTLFFN